MKYTIEIDKELLELVNELEAFFNMGSDQMDEKVWFENTSKLERTIAYYICEKVKKQIPPWEPIA